jgi:hypothetical protein
MADRWYRTGDVAVRDDKFGRDRISEQLATTPAATAAGVADGALRAAGTPAERLGLRT